MFTHRTVSVACTVVVAGSNTKSWAWTVTTVAPADPGRIAATTRPTAKRTSTLADLAFNPCTTLYS